MKQIKNKNKANFSDVSGYITLLICCIFLIYKFGFLLYFDTLYLISGETKKVSVNSIVYEKPNYRYVFIIDSKEYVSIKTSESIKIGEKCIIRVNNINPSAVFGKFQLGLYIFTIVFFTFILLLCVLSVIRLNNLLK